MSLTRDNRRKCTLFAWRYRREAKYPHQRQNQWTMDAVFMNFDALQKLWTEIRSGDIEMRFIREEDVAEKKTDDPKDGTTTESICSYTPVLHGWWQDPFTHKWLAPEETLEVPKTPCFSTQFQCDFIAESRGWLNVVFRDERQSGNFDMSNVFDPTGYFLDWLEKILHGEAPRFEIDEEGVYAELHALPVTWIKDASGKDVQATPEQKKQLVEIAVIRDGRFADLLFHGVFVREDFVRAAYAAFLKVQETSEDMRDWPYADSFARFGDRFILDENAPITARAPMLDRLLSSSSVLH